MRGQVSVRSSMAAVTLVNPMAGHKAALELRGVMKSALSVAMIMAIIVVIADYNTPEDYAGPKPRGDDGNSILLNLSAGIKRLWQRCTGHGDSGAEL